MLKTLVLLAYLVASLSASDATPGDTLRVYAGCDSGRVTIEPQQGLSYAPTRGTGNAQTIDVRVLPDAWPTVHRLRVVCGEASALLTLGVRGGFVPLATQRPDG